MRPSDPRGILYPARLPTFHREPAPEGLHDRVRWCWVPRWELQVGRTSRQRVLPFPAANLVVEQGGVSLVGPQTGISHRDLTGTGWAVGLLLRPGGLASLSADPRELLDREVPFEAPELQRAIESAMDGSDGGVDAAVRAVFGWAERYLAPPEQGAVVANDMEELVAGDATIVRIEQVAERLGLSVRGVQRVARRYLGVTPLAVIRRYRLQEAAQRLREDSTSTIARVAAELGYADHSHLTADFRAVLGYTPSAYRQDSDHGRGSATRGPDPAAPRP